MYIDCAHTYTITIQINAVVNMKLGLLRDYNTSFYNMCTICIDLSFILRFSMRKRHQI